MITITAGVCLSLESGPVDQTVKLEATLPMLMLLTEGSELLDCMLITAAFTQHAGLSAEDDVFAARLSQNTYVVLYKHEAVGVARIIEKPHLEGQL